MNIRCFYMVVGLFAFVHCGNSMGPIDMRLVVDPNLNTKQQVLRELEMIQTTLDSDEGLYPQDFDVPVQEHRVVNVDQDSAFELQVDIPIDPQAQDFPTVRIEKGSFGDEVELDISLVGWNVNELIAQGGAQNISFTHEKQQLAVPFNLHPRRLAPRVTHVLPTQTDTLRHCSLSSVLVMFSKPIEIQDMDAIQVAPVGPNIQLELDPVGRYVRINNPGFKETENLESNRDTFPFRITYELTIEANAISDGSRLLDQSSTTDGNQPYAATFSIPCQIGSVQKTRECPVFPRLKKVEDRCFPGSCDGILCPIGFICNPNQASCDVDCRTYLPGDGCITGICNADTGVCEP